MTASESAKEREATRRNYDLSVMRITSPLRFVFTKKDADLKTITQPEPAALSDNNQH